MAGVSDEQQSEFFIVQKEIMSLNRERRYLLNSLSPQACIWANLEDEGMLVRMLAGHDYMEQSGMESGSTVEQLERYFQSILQDMEDLSSRMLSTAYAVVKPGGATLSSYMADELVNSTSILKDTCKKLYEDTNVNEEAEEEQNNRFLDFCGKFLEKPLNYRNDLAVVVTREEEQFFEEEVEKLKKRAEERHQQNMLKKKRWEEREKVRERYYKEMKKGKGKEMEKEFELMHTKEKDPETEEEKKQKEKDQEMENKKEKATMEYLKNGMEVSVKLFALHPDGWETGWGSKSVRCGGFGDKTTLSPMHFTLYTTDTIRSSCGVTGSTLQIYSIQIIKLKEGLNWPLKLHGVVAARDAVDRNRNILFSRSRLNSQELYENGSLCLTGPSRAIVALGPVDFEIELRVEVGEESQDKELITLSKRYDGTNTSLNFENSLCTVELKLKQLSEAVQATVMGVHIEGDWPFEYGCRVFCYLSAAADEAVTAAADEAVTAAADEVVLLDCPGKMNVRSDGCLHLSRNVVSVQSGARMIVVIRSYGRAAQDWKVEFPAKHCQTMESECSIGNTKVKVVVAWSLLVKEKQDILVDYPAVFP